MEVTEGVATCTSCQQPKPAGEFHRATQGRRGVRSRCITCRRAHDVARRAAKLAAMTPAELEAHRVNGREATSRSRTKRRAEMGEEAYRARRQQHRLNEDPARRRLRAWRSQLARYGLTVAQYDAMLASQGGACATCGAKDRKLCVDHDHATGQVRQILCEACNFTVGLIAENPETAESIASYLRKWNP